MKNCWKILDIEETTDVDIIRRAYLALLPSFHFVNPLNDFLQKYLVLLFLCLLFFFFF